MTDVQSFRVNDRPKYRSRGFGTPSVSVGLSHAKVAREKKPPTKAAKPKPAAAVAPIVQPSIAVSPPAVIGRTIETYDDLIAAFRSAKDLRGMSNHHCDELCNLATGHSDAILGPTQRKHLGHLSFNALAWAFCVKFIMIRDVEREAEMAVHWADRQRQIPHVREPSRVSKILIERATPYVMSTLAKKGWETRRSKARKS